MFFINLPIGIVGYMLARRVLEPDRPQPTERLDFIGLGVLSPGLALFLYGLAQTAPDGIGDARAWAPIVAGGGLIAAFVVRSWRSATRWVARPGDQQKLAQNMTKPR